MIEKDFPFPFPALAGPLTRDELREGLISHPDLQPMGGQQEIIGQIFVTFVLRTADQRVLALFFGPETAGSSTYVLINWLPVPTPQQEPASA